MDDRERAQDIALHERHTRQRRGLPTRHRPLGHVRPDRDRVPAQPLVQRPPAADHDPRLRPRAAGLEIDGRRSHVERSGTRDQGHGSHGLQRQAVDHRRPHERELRLRGLGSPGLPGERARECGRFVSHELVQRPGVVRAVVERRCDVGTRQADLRPGPARPDDRQSDRRPTERRPGRHLHGVQQREREEAPRRVHPCPSLDRQGRHLVRDPSMSAGWEQSERSIPRAAIRCATGPSSRTSRSIR